MATRIRQPRPAAAPGPATREVRALLDWFARHARPLPWRRTTDPYAIWVSEVMLQQTQVATVIPYWERWMQTLPTLYALAQANETQVLKLWEGLGYYRRARHLHAAARFLVQHHGGRFPDTPDDLLALPGIGRYTAGALLSIAFNQPTPVLDGNVQRVLCRVHALPGNPRTPATHKVLWRLAQAWVEKADALGKKYPHRYPRACSALNQALMELGAVVCTPRQPQCPACPLRHACCARAAGQTEKFPLRARRPALRRRFTLAAVVEHHGKVLVRQRPAGGVNGGLWEFPGLELPTATARSDAEQAQKLLGWLQDTLDLRAQAARPWLALRHTITRHRYEVRVWRMVARRAPTKLSHGRWVGPADLEQLPMPATHRRIARRWITSA